MIEDKSGFIKFIGNLDVKESTKRVYKSLIDRIAAQSTMKVNSVAVRTKNGVQKLSENVAKHGLTLGHLKDIKLILNYYRSYSMSKTELELSDEEISTWGEERFAGGRVKGDRQRILQSIILRRGQNSFRKRLLEVYSRKCCVTQTDLPTVLEAAHITPYSLFGASSLSNGLLLRSDVHVLFDLHLLSINPKTRSIYCSHQIRCKEYAVLHGAKAQLPKQKKHQPSVVLLKQHFHKTKANSFL